MSDIIVKFKPMGQKQLIEAIKKLETAQGKATAATKKNRLETGRLRGSMSGLEKSFATIRSNMLLYSFAMSLGIRQMGLFAQQAAKIQTMEKAFDNLTGGADNATIAINKLRQATDGTISDFHLFQQANNAMILGLSTNSDEMAQLFDMAQRLGDALGRDVKTSIESLVTGIGRQSRLMLDNIGIIVKADDAYRSYAAEIGKTADTLTQSEKKQAFMNAALDAAREKLESLPQEVITADKKFQQFSASIENLQKTIGDTLLPDVLDLTVAMTDMANAFDAERAQAYATVIKVGLVGGMVLYAEAVMKAVIAQKMLGWPLLIGTIVTMASELVVLSGIFEGAGDSVNKAEQSTSAYLKSLVSMKKEDIVKELDKQQKSQSDLNKQLKDRGINTKETTNLNLIAKQIIDGQTTSIQDNVFVYQNLNKQKDQFNKVTKESNADLALNKQEVDSNVETLTEYLEILEAGFDTVQSYTDSQGNALEMYGKTRESQKETLDAQMIELENLLKLEKGNKEYVAVLEMLKNKKAAILQAELQAQLKTYSRMAQGIATVADAMGAGAKEVAAIQAAGAVVDAFAGASAARFNANKANLPVPIPGLMYAIELAAGLANARAVAMAANKVGGGASGAGGVYGKFEQGGYVGGRPHSQGGTIIEAERGEFVMSRNAVESIGLETLNQMNQTGGGGNINVNVSGNVLTQDFVEGELAESIKEAVRRGSDFGIG